MGLFGRRKERKARDKPVRDEARAGKRWNVRSPRDLRMVTRPRADQTIGGNEAIYAAVSRIANTVASMPMHFYKGYEIQKDHPLERLVNLEPHPNFSAFSWKQTMEVLLNTEGTAYALRVLNRSGELLRLDILNPRRVTPKTDPEGNIWYGVDGGAGPRLPDDMPEARERQRDPRDPAVRRAAEIPGL